MPIQLPNLDDRRFTDLVEEGKRLIPGLAPSWTDHNPSDPGITFIELFAYIAEMLMYRVDRISEANKLAFVKLLRGPEWKPTPGLSIDAEVRDAVRELRVEERAVTPKDFERLAREADPRVARAMCLPRRNLDAPGANAATTDAPGHVSVIVVPRDSQPAQPPEVHEDLRAGVETDLAPRCLLTTRLHVALPRYVKVAVNLVAHVFADQDVPRIEDAIKARLTAYFHPLTGGPGGQGWAFGQAVYVSSLYACLDEMDGVDYVTPQSGQPELVADNNPQSARRILEGSGPAEQLIGVSLKPNELVEFDLNDSTIDVQRHTASVPEE